MPLISYVQFTPGAIDERQRESLGKCGGLDINTRKNGNTLTEVARMLPYLSSSDSEKQRLTVLISPSSAVKHSTLASCAGKQSSC
jgi:hypothetical protein